MASRKIVELLPPNANGILILDKDCASEIISIVNEGAYHVQFAQDYKARLKLLLQYREQAIFVNRQWFEHLKNTDSGMNSMHLARIGNMRILYIVKSRIIFLCAFKEKEGKGRKRQSYKQYIPIAEKRLERYKEV